MKLRSFLPLALALAITMMISAPSANAATFYWDANGNLTTAIAPTGIWGTSNFWSTDSTGATATSAQTIDNTSDLFFSAASNGLLGTVTVLNTQAAHSITFDDATGAITLSGGTAINLGSATAGSGIFFTNATGSANVISTPIILNSAANAIAISDSGTALQTIGAITGAATTGTQTITAGTSSSGGITLGGIIGNGAAGGNVALTINSSGSGTVTLNQANTFTGGVTLTSGILNINNASALGGAAGTFAINGGTIDNTSAGAVTTSANPITVGGNFAYGGFQALTLAGTVNLGAATRTITVNTNALTLSGIISNGGLTKSGAGTLILSGANTYTGTTTVSGGVLRLNNATALSGGINATGGTSALTINGGVVGLGNGNFLRNLGAGADQFQITGGVSGFSAFNADRTVTVNNNSATEVVWGSASFQPTTLVLQDVTTTAGTLTFSNNIDLNGATRTIAVNSVNSYGSSFSATLSGVIRNSSGVTSGLTKIGIGTLNLSAANTYDGATTVSAGVLNIRNNTSLGAVTNGTSVASGASLQIQGGITVGAEALTINGTGFNYDGALRSISGNNTYGGLVTLGSSTIISSETAANTLTLSNTGTITGAGFDLTAGGAGNITINSNIGTTTGGLTKVGAGTVTLAGTNTYTGNTLVRSGTLQFNTSASLYDDDGSGANWTKDNIKVERGATMAFRLDSLSQFSTGNIDTLLGLSDSASNGFMSGSILGLDTTLGNHLYDSVIANPNSGANVLGLTKLGTNTLTLDQANTYTGGTTISAGTLQIGNGSTTGSLSATGGILNNGTLTINRSNAVAQGTDFSAAPIVGTGAFIKLGAGTTTLNAANTFSGSTTVSAGVLNLTNALALQNSALVTTGAGKLTLTGPTSLTLGGLSGATGNLATIFTSGFTGTVTNLTLNPNSGSVTYGGVIANGTMSLTKTGLGTQILSGANTYTGDTIVNAGTLTLGSGATGSISSSSALKIGGGSTFNYARTGTGQTVNGLTINAGNSTINNTSGQTLTLAAITRTGSAFGTVNFGATTLGTINTTFTNVDGIIGAWATTGATTTLRYAVGGGNISALTGTTATAADLSNLTAGGNFEYSAAATTVGNLSANTLRYSGAATTTAIGATNTLTLNGLMNAGTGTLTISGGPSTGGIIIGSTNELDIIANAQATTISSVIKDGGAAGSLVYSGGGTLTLSGVNLYTGGTTINAGTLTINNNSALGSGAVTVNNTGTLNLGNAVLTKNLTLNGGTLGIGAGNGTGALSGTIVLAANSNIAPNISNGNQIPLSASISGPGGLTSTAEGLLLLTGANTYTGPTVINQGAWVFKSSIYGNDTTQWTPANITVASNAVLGMSVGGSGEFTMAQAATMFTNLTTGVNNNGMLANSFMSLDTRNAPAGTYTYSAALTDSTGPGGGAVNFVSYGSSNTTLELTGANTYSGVTMLRNNGTLRVSSFNSVFTNPTLGTVHSASSSLGAPTTVANGTIWLGETSWNGNRMPGNIGTPGNLTYTGTGETTDRVIFLGGYAGNKYYTLDQSGTGLLKFLSNFDQQISNTHHNLILAGSTTGTGEIAGAIIQAFNGGAAWYTNVTKNGTGTWTLSGANTYNGTTTINRGTLIVGGANNLPVFGTWAVNAGGTSSFADGTVRNTTGGTVTLATGANLAFDWSSAGTVDNLAPTVAIAPAANATIGIIINPIGTPTGGGNLLTGIAGSTLHNPNYFLANNTNFTATITKPVGAGAGSVSIGSYAGATALTDAYWRGGLTSAVGAMALSSGGTTSTSSNWFSSAAGASAAGVVPGGSAVNVIFGATGGSNQGSVTAGADMNLGSITFNDTAAVTIAGPNAITLNSTSGTAATTSAALASVTAGSAISVTSFANATNTINANIVLGANQTWNIASGKTLAVGGVVSGNKSLTIAGASGSVVTLSGNNIYYGATTVTGGTIRAASASTPGTSGAFGYNSAITLNNTAGVTMDLNNQNTQIGSLSGGGANGGNVTLGTATLTLTGDNTSPSIYAGVISGTGGLTKIIDGTQALSGLNTYTGKTTIRVGTLAINSIANGGSASSIGQSSALPVNLTLSGSTLQYAPISGVGAAGHSTDRNFLLIASSTIDASGTGALTFNTPTGNIISPDVTGLTGSWGSNTSIITGLSSTANLAIGMSVNGTGLAPGTRIVSIDSASQVTLSRNTLAAGTTLAVAFGFGALDTRTLTLTGTNTNANTIAGNLQDSSAAGAGILGLNKSGVGTWNLSGTNTYTGATIVSGGSLQIGAGGTTGSLTGTASITNNANLTINRSDAFTQAAGLNNKVISGTGSFTQAGGGTTTLSLTNTYTGATTVTTGTLQLDGSTHASSTVGIGTAGTLTGTGTVNGNATLTGNGIINKASGTLAGTLGVTGGNWNGAGSVTGLVTSSSGTFTIGSGANLTANGNLNITGGTIAAGDATSTITGSVNYTSVSNSTFAGVIAGASKTLTMNGVGAKLILSGANTYTGATTVTNGILAVNGSLASISTTVGSGATLQGSGSIAGSVTVNDGGILATGNSIESLATGTLSLLANSTLAYEIDNDALPGVAGDLTAVTGNLTLDSGNLTNLTLTELGLGSWTVGEKLTLISYSGTWNGGLFNYSSSTLADDSTFAFSGSQWSFNYDDTAAGDNYTGDLTGLNFVTMTVIPEPNVAALVGALGFILLLRRRR